MLDAERRAETAARWDCTTALVDAHLDAALCYDRTPHCDGCLLTDPAHHDQLLQLWARLDQLSPGHRQGPAATR